MTPKPKTPGGKKPGGGDPGDAPKSKPATTVGKVDASTVSEGIGTTGEFAKAGRSGQGTGQPGTPGKPGESGQPKPHDPTQPQEGVTFDDPTHPKLGSDGKYYVKDGDQDVPIDDPKQTGRTITDIDRTQDGVLWEEKSATTAGDTQRWVDKHVTKKMESYVEARQHIAGREDAPIGLHFTKAGADPAFRAAVEQAVADMRVKHPDVEIRVKWTE